MGSEKSPLHILLVSFPGQGHVNPLLRLGKRLACNGLLVTLATTEDFGKRMRKANKIKDGELAPIGSGFLRFEFFEDGWEEDDTRRPDLDTYMPQLELVGRKEVSRLIRKYADQDSPVSCLINNPFIPWVSDLAAELGIPSAMLWVQSCACFAAYYHYYRGSVTFPTEDEPEMSVQIPGLPLLKYDEVPSFLHPFSPYGVIKRAILGQFEKLEKPFVILMDTFEGLEKETIEYMSRLLPIKNVGPLFKSPGEQTVCYNNAVRADFLTASDDCIEWLDSQPVSSVVYVSFGSVVAPKQEQVTEIAHGLLSSGVRFLWVVRPPEKRLGQEASVLPKEIEESGKGKLVEWAPQENVLAHPALACFLTHCGWNSSMESLTLGVPVIAFPRWGDQVTNAVFLADVFEVGIRMCRGEAENRIVPREEVEKCLREATAGPKAEEMKQNASKWKAAAAEALAEGGSSRRNVEAFVDELLKRRTTEKATAESNMVPTPLGDNCPTAVY